MLPNNYKQRIADLEQRQERMTAENVIVRKYQRDRKDGINIDAANQAALTALQALTGYDQERAAAHLARLLAPDYAGRVGWPAYELTNNNANIRRLRERLEQVKESQATPATTIEGINGIRFEDCPADNRVRLFFPGKRQPIALCRITTSHRQSLSAASKRRASGRKGRSYEQTQN